MARISVRGVSRVYTMPSGARTALHNVSLEVDHGEFLCLVGPSGCGKTTLLNILSGLDSADDGEVSVESLDGGSPVMGYVFQESRLMPWLTVRENLAFVQDDRGRTATNRIDRWLNKVGLNGRANDYPRQLSVGQRQRVAVARALLIGPDVLFMDEPFSALDELTASLMREELLVLWQELGCTVVFVTHNPLEATFLADRVAIMTPGPGRILMDYKVSDIIPRPRDGDDSRLWEASRVVVRALRGEGHAA